jgi:two-component system, NarL family, response regulator NreC
VRACRVTAILAGCGLVCYASLRRPILTWGATGAEAGSRLPGDELLESADGVSTRAIDIHAPASAVWPWLAQMGPLPRGGAYSYDWIENLLGLNMHSAGRILPQFQHPEIGETIGLGANRMRLERVEPEHVLAWRSQDGNWVWTFVLREDHGTTRLISRNRFRLPTPLARVAMLPMEPGSLVMERKMLLGIKKRAESLAGAAPTPSRRTSSMLRVTVRGDRTAPRVISRRGVDTFIPLTDQDATPTDAAPSDDAAPMEPIRIVLADDHAVVRTGLRMLLDSESDFEVVAEASDVEGARRYLRGHRPGVLVLDLNMPGGSSLEAIPVIREEFPDTQIVVLTMQQEPAFAREALRAGALGYVLKEAADDELVEAVRRADVGERYLNPRLGALIASEPPPGPPDDLSEREVDVLRLIALGHTNAEIAEQLFLSVRTVETHRSHIQQKLRLSTRAELVGYALERGLIGAEGEHGSRPAPG